MDLAENAQDHAFRMELREWLAREIPAHGAPPTPDDWPARRAYDTAWQRKLFDAGLACIDWPEQYGGRGASPTRTLAYHEEVARAKAPYIGVNFIGVKHGGPTLIAEGSEAQRRHHLPRIARGDEVWAQGFSEPDAGSDLASLRTKALRDGDDYVVTGQKIWTTYGQVADVAELLVRTDPDQQRHAGLSWLILPMDAPGVRLRPIRTIAGETDFNELFLDEVRVPVANRVGAENDGWRVSQVTLRFERGTAWVGHVIAQHQFLAEIAAAAKRVTRHEASAWEDASLRKQVGRLQAELDGLWGLIRMGVSASNDHGVQGTGSSAVKLLYTELDQKLGELATQVLGRAGLSRSDLGGLPNERFLGSALRSLNLTISGGTSQINRNILAERILGLPREPKAR